MKEKIKEVIDKGQRFLVTTHVDPDGDAIGSSFALSFSLKELKKIVTLYFKEEIPYRYTFLPHPEPVIYSLPEESFDGIFILDCGKFSRVGDGYELLKTKGPIISIDHHDQSEPFGLINLIDVNASSTAEILFFLFSDLGIEMGYEIAINLYTAILTETGSFRFENTSEKTFFIASELLKRGVDPSFVARMVYENHPPQRFHLLSLVLQTLSLYKDGRVSFAYLTSDMLEKTNAKKEYSDGFVEYLREIEGIEVAIFLREIDTDTYKISMRSKGRVDVAELLSNFGGGGHSHAAGCIMKGGIEKIKERLLEALPL